MTKLVEFSQSVPAAIKQLFGETAADELIGSGGLTGFPVISIKGKVFHVVRGDERTLVTKPDDDDPASSIEVVIIRSNPNRSKVYYAGGYVEGSNDKPLCYSNDGVAPAADAAEPQAKKCATCPHNQWGSKITDNGAKGKACADSRRLAVATVNAIGDPMLLRVPAASIKALTEYGRLLAARGVPPQAVVTKISFDHSVAHPALVFKPVGLVSDAQTLQQIAQMRESDVVLQIVGMQADEGATLAAEATAGAVEATPAPAPAPAPSASRKPASAAVPKAAKTTDTTAAVSAVEAAPVEQGGDPLLDDLSQLLSKLSFEG